MSKIAEKKAFELGHFKDPFNREEFTANDIFDACVECYDQAMQDFLEKAEAWLEPTFKNIAGYNCGGDLMNDFKNYMQDESEN